MRRFLTLAFLLVILALPLALTAQVINTFGPLNGNNVWTGTDQFTLGITAGPIPFSQLSSISTSTTLIYVSNATLGSSPCTGGGTGALAIYINGAWNCAAGTTSGGSGITGSGTGGVIPLWTGSGTSTILGNSSLQEYVDLGGGSSTLAFKVGNSDLVMGTPQGVDNNNLTSISRSSNIVTAVCGAESFACDFPVGVTVRIYGVTDSSYDGTFVVTSISSNGTSTNSSFTYNQSGANSSSTGGGAELYTSGSGFFGGIGYTTVPLGVIIYAASSSFGTAPGIQLINGNSGNDGAGSPILLQGGNTTDVLGGVAGGAITLIAGSSLTTTTSNAGGNINLQPGAGSDGGASGVVNILPAQEANLPTCNSALEGSLRPLTNSNTTTWGATISGTGLNHVLAYCDGTNWTVAAQ